MTVIIRALRHGVPVAFCDDRCYNHPRSKAACICSGINRGVGFIRAWHFREDTAAKIQAFHNASGDPSLQIEPG